MIEQDYLGWRWKDSVQNVPLWSRRPLLCAGLGLSLLLPEGHYPGSIEQDQLDLVEQWGLKSRIGSFSGVTFLSYARYIFRALSHFPR